MNLVHPSPAALDSVRISLPKTEDTPASEVALSAVATVSTKANVMTINVFDETVGCHRLLAIRPFRRDCPRDAT